MNQDIAFPLPEPLLGGSASASRFPHSQQDNLGYCPASGASGFGALRIHVKRNQPASKSMHEIGLGFCSTCFGVLFALGLLFFFK